MIAFCTTCKGRVQHIKETLPKNLAHNAGNLSKFILLDYNSHDGLAEYVKQEFAKELESGKLVVYACPEPAVFHMTHAKNMAHRLGILEGADILCNLDADNFTGEGFDKYITQKFRNKNNVFLWSRMFTQDNGRRPRGINGRIIVSAQAFIKVGGYNEKYATWDHDDKDFNSRLRKCGYEAIEVDPKYLDVVLHTDKMRFKDYPQAACNNTENNDIIEDTDHIVVNYGKIGIGIVFKNYDWRYPILIERVPTRIFGIGLHKTGTTSLHAALRMLGFESDHWKNAHWAKAIWEEMLAGKSKTVEQSYALSDLPIAILYKKLDKAYPGSKFILTMRSEGSWLRSIEDHWDINCNPFRAQWATDPFSHKVHKLVYGQQGFDAVLFLARFRKHNEDVRAYFKGREDDLLVMNMSNGAGWHQLCPFLGVESPAKPYPKKLVTERKT